MSGMRWVACLAVVLAFAAGCTGPGNGRSELQKVTTAVGEFEISEPHVFRNLTVFLIHGDDQVTGKTFLTLDEALEQKKVVVHETGNVRELAIENKSAREHVYVPSGSIVKGGKQDRTIQYDMVLPPKSGAVPLASFCVESGRWSARGSEKANEFSSAKDNLATRELKLAAKLKGSQSEVWQNVDKAQAGLSGNVGQTVSAGESPSSLQLTLEHKKVRQAIQAYTDALEKAVEGQDDVVGYAFAINGEINSADVYGSAELFRKLWPDLLEATAVEAVAKMQEGKTFPAARPPAVARLFADAAGGKESEKKLADGGKLTIKESDKSVLFLVTDGAEPSKSYRTEYISK